MRAAAAFGRRYLRPFIEGLASAVLALVAQVGLAGDISGPSLKDAPALDAHARGGGLAGDISGPSLKERHRTANTPLSDGLAGDISGPSLKGLSSRRRGRGRGRRLAGDISGPSLKGSSCSPCLPRLGRLAGDISGPSLKVDRHGDARHCRDGFGRRYLRPFIEGRLMGHSATVAEMRFGRRYLRPFIEGTSSRRAFASSARSLAGDISGPSLKVDDAGRAVLELLAVWPEISPALH